MPDLSIINGFQSNTRSIKSVDSSRNNLAEFQSLVSVKNTMVICLTETCLSAEIVDDEILPIDSYKIYRKARGWHGTVLTEVHTSINCKDHHKNIISVEIRLPKLPQLALINFYRPPSDISHGCVENVEETMNKVKRSGFTSICSMGNFNLPNMDPATSIPLDNRWHCEALYNVFQFAGLSHMVTGPTHERGDPLDFILATYFTDIDTSDELFTSFCD